MRDNQTELPYSVATRTCAVDATHSHRTIKPVERLTSILMAINVIADEVSERKKNVDNFIDTTKIV